MCKALPANPSVSSNSAHWAGLEFQSGRNYFSPLQISTAAKPFNDPFDSSEPVENESSSTPSVAQLINCSAASWGPSTCGRAHIQLKTLAVPADMQPAGNTDHHFSFESASAGGEYDFWLANPPGSPGSTLTVGSGGFCKWGTDGTGCSGATASDQAVSMGGIDPTILKAAESQTDGTLGYAITVATICNDTTFVYPATASDGQNSNGFSACAGSTGPGQRPPEGTRFFLNMSDAQVDATNNAPYVKVILRTIDRQHYGGNVLDTNGSWGPGMMMQYRRGDYSFAANEAGIALQTDMSIPVTTNGIDLSQSIVFCTNGTC